MTIHAISYLHQSSVDTSKKMDLNILNQVEGKFWSRMAYKIDKYVFSLDEIEHGVLRSNREHPSKFISFFKPEDERLKFVVKNFDPRIHFALNCGAKVEFSRFLKKIEFFC